MKGHTMSMDGKVNVVQMSIPPNYTFNSVGIKVIIHAQEKTSLLVTY